MYPDNKKPSELVKLFRALSFLSLSLTLIFFRWIPASAESGDKNDFVIRTYNVQIVANADRSCDITETLDVHFNESQHGILREIKTDGDREKEVLLSNVQVAGAPFQDEGNGTLRIGDPDKKVKGDQRYVIGYTLNHFANQIDGFDFLYLDLIGTENAVPVESAQISLKLPDSAQIHSIALYSGESGSKENPAAQYIQDGQLISVTNTRKLEAGEGISILVQLEPGAFPEAIQWTPQLIYNSIDVHLKMDDFGHMHVTQNWDVTVNRASAIDLPLQDYFETIYSAIKNVTILLPDGTRQTDDENVYIDFSPYTGKQVRVQLYYDKSFLVGIRQQPFRLEQLLLQNNNLQAWQKMTVTLDFPFPVTALSLKRSTGDDESSDYQDVKVNLNGTSASASWSGNDQEVLDVWLQADMPENSFRYQSIMMDVLIWLLPLLAGCAIISLALTQRNRLLNPTPDFYPPKGINPAEAGYIIDNELSRDDVVSIIFYWASKGYLGIELQDKEYFYLHKRGEPSGNSEPYEKALFDALWEENAKVVGKSELRDSYYTAIDKAIGAVKKKYSGEHSLKDRKRNLIFWLSFWALSLLCPLMVYLFLQPKSAFRVYEGFFMIVSLGLNWLLCYLVAKYVRYRQKGRGFFRKFLYALTILSLAAAAVFTGMMVTDGKLAQDWQVFAAPFCLSLAFGFLPLIQRHSAYGCDELEKVLGFKQFLTLAEKDRLLLLLKENPEYYYDILPYAQVLGVSKIWQEKFSDISMPEPSYCSAYTSYGAYSMFSSINDVTKSMRSSMTSTPSGSGGGSSGGGSGGGGVSGW